MSDLGWKPGLPTQPGSSDAESSQSADTVAGALGCRDSIQQPGVLGPGFGPLMKDAHEVKQIEPARTGFRGQPPRSLAYYGLRHAYRGFRVRNLRQGSWTK